MVDRRYELSQRDLIAGGFIRGYASTLKQQDLDELIGGAGNSVDLVTDMAVAARNVADKLEEILNP